MTRVGASLVRVTGQKEPRGSADDCCFVWYRVDRSHGWHYANSKTRVYERINPSLAMQIGINDGTRQPYRARPKNVERAKVMNARRSVSALEQEALARDENGELPDSLDSFFAVRAVAAALDARAAADQVAAAGKPMTKKALKEAAKAERERLKAEKEAAERFERTGVISRSF